MSYAKDEGYMCECTPRFDVQSRVDTLFGHTAPFRMEKRDTGFYDVLDADGYRANSLSLCEHEAERLCVALNRN